jgi:hypothetical protein
LIPVNKKLKKKYKIEKYFYQTAPALLLTAGVISIESILSPLKEKIWALPAFKSVLFFRNISI